LRAAAISRELGLPRQQIEGVYFAGLIHDVGKIGIPAEILNKPGKLSTLENTTPIPRFMEWAPWAGQ